MPSAERGFILLKSEFTDVDTDYSNDLTESGSKLEEKIS